MYVQTVEIGQVRMRIEYALKVVGFLSPQVAILEGVEDGRRTTVAVSEVATWRQVFDNEEDALLAAAIQLGTEAGLAAASWINVDTQTAELLKGIEEGDPEVLDQLPFCDLSGQWADNPTALDVVRDIHNEADVDFDGELSDDGDVQLLDEYEGAFRLAVEAEVVRRAKAHLAA